MKNKKNNFWNEVNYGSEENFALAKKLIINTNINDVNFHDIKSNVVGLFVKIAQEKLSNEKKSLDHLFNDIFLSFFHDIKINKEIKFEYFTYGKKILYVTQQAHDFIYFQILKFIQDEKFDGLDFLSESSMKELKNILNSKTEIHGLQKIYYNIKVNFSESKVNSILGQLTAKERLEFEIFSEIRANFNKRFFSNFPSQKDVDLVDVELCRTVISHLLKDSYANVNRNSEFENFYVALKDCLILFIQQNGCPMDNWNNLLNRLFYIARNHIKDAEKINKLMVDYSEIYNQHFININYFLYRKIENFYKSNLSDLLRIEFYKLFQDAGLTYENYNDYSNNKIIHELDSILEQIKSSEILENEKISENSSEILENEKISEKSSEILENEKISENSSKISENSSKISENSSKILENSSKSDESSKSIYLLQKFKDNKYCFKKLDLDNSFSSNSLIIQPEEEVEEPFSFFYSGCDSIDLAKLEMYLEIKEKKIEAREAFINNFPNSNNGFNSDSFSKKYVEYIYFKNNLDCAIKNIKKDKNISNKEDLIPNPKRENLTKKLEELYLKKNEILSIREREMFESLEKTNLNNHNFIYNFEYKVKFVDTRNIKDTRKAGELIKQHLDSKKSLKVDDFNKFQDFEQLKSPTTSKFDEAIIENKPEIIFLGEGQTSNLQNKKKVLWSSEWSSDISDSEISKRKNISESDKLSERLAKANDLEISKKSVTNFERLVESDSDSFISDSNLSDNLSESEISKRKNISKSVSEISGISKRKDKLSERLESERLESERLESDISESDKLSERLESDISESDKLSERLESDISESDKLSERLESDISDSDISDSDISDSDIPDSDKLSVSEINDILDENKPGFFQKILNFLKNSFNSFKNFFSFKKDLSEEDLSEEDLSEEDLSEENQLDISDSSIESLQKEEEILIDESEIFEVNKNLSLESDELVEKISESDEKTNNSLFTTIIDFIIKIFGGNS